VKMAKRWSCDFDLTKNPAAAQFKLAEIDTASSSDDENKNKSKKNKNKKVCPAPTQAIQWDEDTDDDDDKDLISATPESVKNLDLNSQSPVFHSKRRRLSLVGQDRRVENDVEASPILMQSQSLMDTFRKRRSTKKALFLPAQWVKT
jgi:hypothetical protein